ncbi:hypothetical protein BSM4216_2352 [Bacillus smithii]|nr:hypothetical protein BSM4216_2352 [Bacillus smithii]
MKKSLGNEQNRNHLIKTSSKAMHRGDFLFVFFINGVERNGKFYLMCMSDFSLRERKRQLGF